jgi:hypothetical protein
VFAIAAVFPACSDSRQTIAAIPPIEAGTSLDSAIVDSGAPHADDGRGGDAGHAPRPDAPTMDVAASDGAVAPDAERCALEGSDASGRDWPARGLLLYEADALQAVSIPIMARLAEVTERKADVVADRSVLIRAYVAPLSGFRPRPIRARLTVVHGDAGDAGAPLVIEETKVIDGESNDETLASTFNFELDAALVRPGTRYAIEILETDPCEARDGGAEGTRFPINGTSDLGVRVVGKVHILLVPVTYTLRGNTLAPDTSAAQLERYRNTLLKLFPVTGVDISVRAESVATTTSDMRDVLDQITALRDHENTDPLLSYYGAVRFTETRAEYCAPNCVLGAGVVGTSPSNGGGSAVGVGYPDDGSAFTFAHELGHVYGAQHSPCNVDGDPAYPYRAGGIGSWGYDSIEHTMLDPGEYKDVMGYCSPVWISDYVYGHLESYIAQVETSFSAMRAPAARTYRTLLLESGRPPRWGRPRRLRGEPNGVRELADVLDRSGNVVDVVSVYRAALADVDTEQVYVPDLGSLSLRRSIRVKGRPALELEGVAP